MNNILTVDRLEAHVPFTIVFWDDTFDEALNDSTSDVYRVETDSIVSKVSVKEIQSITGLSQLKLQKYESH